MTIKNGITYDWATPSGVPGGIADLAPHAIDSFINESKTGELKFGMGVVQGKTPGTTVKVPSSGSDKFEGVVIDNGTTELDLDGNIHIYEGAPVGVMRYGRVWVPVAKAELTGDKVKYGVRVGVYATTAGEKGKFGADGSIKINARFLSGVDNGLALIELFNPNTDVK